MQFRVDDGDQTLERRVVVSSRVTSCRGSGMGVFYACFRAFLVLTRVFRLQRRRDEPAPERALAHAATHRC
jgi:hypothetical protein